MKKLTQSIENTLNKKIIIAFAASTVLSFLFTPIIAHADAPTLGTFLGTEKVKAALGWGALAIAAAYIVCLFIGFIKLAPVAMAFWRRQDGINQGLEVSKGYLIGFAFLIVGPTIFLAIIASVFGTEIVDAVKTAISSVFK